MTKERRVNVAGYQGPDRRQFRNLRERILREPVATTALFTVLGVLAYGIASTNSLAEDQATAARLAATRAADLSEQNQRILDSLETSTEFLEGCVTPGEPCYQLSLRVASENRRVIVEAVACILLIAPQSRTADNVQQCIVTAEEEGRTR